MHMFIFLEVGGETIVDLNVHFFFIIYIHISYNRYVDYNKKAKHNKNSCRMLGIRKDFTGRPSLWPRKKV